LMMANVRSVISGRSYYRATWLQTDSPPMELPGDGRWLW
jgi:hypothetical protein